MSAPLVVNTKDGTCWTRRTVTSGGLALYAPESVRTCPDFVMATLPELAEHGIVGSADALPMPVAEEPQARTILDRARDALSARLSKDALRHVLENVISYAASLQARVAEMEARLAEYERPADEDPIAYTLTEKADAAGYPPALPWAHTMPDDDLHEFLGDLVSAAMGRWQHSPEVPDREVLAAVEKACADWRTPGQGHRSDQTETAPSLTVYRASHDSIVMGLYTTREAAQTHCEAKVQQEEPAGSILHLSWWADDIGPDAEYELHITPAETGGLIRGTGYVVTALEFAAAYDPDGDE